MDTELFTSADAEKRARLLKESAQLPEVFGVWVLGHSRFGHMVLGSPEDSARWEKVWATRRLCTPARTWRPLPGTT